jgi:4-amino-4-deoxy-L-arabinose transferase-like glycosyltransferase
MLPNTAFLIKGIAGVKKFMRKDLNLFLVIWFMFVFIFFSLAGTKLHHYVVYGYVPLFILMAQATSEIKYTAAHLAWPLAFLLLLFFLPEIAARLQPQIGDEFARYVIADALPLFGLEYKLITGGAALVITALLFVRPVPGMVKIVVAGLIFVVVINLYIVPIAGRIMQQPVKEAALLAKKESSFWKGEFKKIRSAGKTPPPTLSNTAPDIVAEFRGKLTAHMKQHLPAFLGKQSNKELKDFAEYYMDGLSIVRDTSPTRIEGI